jgi:hypothetical protein
MANPTDAEYYEKACEMCGVGGNIEIASPDETEAEQKTRISRSKDQDGETGAYVKAYVWVPLSAVASPVASPQVKCDELDLLFNPRPREPRDILDADDSIASTFALPTKRKITLP